MFDRGDGSWFCLVVERPNAELVGFAKGVLTMEIFRVSAAS
jgi:hypothetical protein